MSAAFDVQAVREGHLQPTRPEIVRQLQQASDRLSMSLNGWSSWPANDHMIVEAINATVGMQILLRQMRAMSDGQK